jgi:hypothetical protein
MLLSTVLEAMVALVGLVETVGMLLVDLMVGLADL